MINIDELKKKIIYRSNYRGTKEMDNLLGAFTKKYINNLNENDLLDLEKLLNIDETGIRTQERVAPLPVFKTGAFNRSAISP